MAHVQPEFHFSHLRPAPPFHFASAEEPTRVSELDAPTHRLLKRTALEPGEFERVELEAVEVMGLWGSTILFARHLSTGEGFTIGESSAAEHVDFELAAEALGALSAPLVEVRAGAPHVIVPQLARVSIKRANEPDATPSQATSVALLSGTVVELELGKLKFRIANVPAGKATPRAGLQGADRSALTAFGLSFAAAAALLGAFAFWMPAMGLSDDEDLDRERLVMMKQYLRAQAERNHDEEEAKDQSGNKDNEPGAPAEAAQGREGAMGKLNAPVSNHRAAVRGDAPQVQLSHSQMVEAAHNFGMIELLGNLATDAGGAGSPFVRDPALGHDGLDAEGGMWGDPGESGGVGGLRLSGLDNGGGGHGVGVGIGGIGTCASGNCGPQGFGRDFGRIKGDYKPGTPTIRPGVSRTSGHLPAEVVQRIVRQNYGRFRMCYENGLRSNPNLTGRVTARFVIGSGGSVTNVQNGGSDIPDSGVVACVVQAFYGLSFPSPESGIVTVSYPIMFSPG